MKCEYVHLFSSCTYTTYVGLCERDTNVERYSVSFVRVLLGGSIKKCNICNVCENRDLDISYI